ncbi:class I SAM-dependent methyltransferase [Cryptosporangium arvum]|uniref:class I SAM-dependent methyltransferase n=1 Tax=Cryptosporangium arvum TaxID=80871 RepID=UPI0004B8D834|nr:class I SAM-dependent methyltransferase [Cryptosporangium arvum]
MTDVFWRAHQDLPREAPGSEATTQLLLQLAGPLPPRPTVLDVGSGTGPATVLLARLTGGHVTAVDRHEPFLAAVADRAKAANVHVETLAASMDALPVEPGSIDLLWSEGAAYVMGFDAALAAWRPLLTPSGVVVLTECEWSTPEPAPGARAFWDAGYPAMRTTAGNVAAIEQAGWSIRAVYALPDSDWDNYYGPLAARIEQLRAEGVPDDELAAVREEIDVRERHGPDYGYTAYVLRPRP